MVRVQAEYPYDEYYLYVVYHKGENRRYANLIPVDKTKNKRKTISYARYLVSVREKRILQSDEYVDHKDDDKTNDDINNLQILTMTQNNRKEARRRGGRCMVELRCPNCGKIFIKEKRQSFLQKNNITFSGCSRICSATFSRKLQLNPDDPKLLEAKANNVIREFKKI